MLAGKSEGSVLLTYQINLYIDLRCLFVIVGWIYTQAKNDFAEIHKNFGDPTKLFSTVPNTDL